MAIYEYKCINSECEEFETIKEFKISISEYSEDKLPICEKCNGKTIRNYTANGFQTFGDGYKG